MHRQWKSLIGATLAVIGAVGFGGVTAVPANALGGGGTPIPPTVSQPTNVSATGTAAGLVLGGTAQCSGPNIRECNLIVTTSPNGTGTGVVSGAWPTWWSPGVTFQLYFTTACFWSAGGFTPIVASNPTPVSVTRPITITPLTVDVGAIDPVARTAQLMGVATKGATIWANGVQIATAANGTWSGTVPGLSEGTNSVVVEQRMSGSVVGSKVTVSITVPRPADNGGFAAVGNGTAVTIPAGESRSVEFGASLTAAVTSMRGTTVTLTAPTGTRFVAGQTTISGQYLSGGEWRDTPSLTLTGAVSADGTTFSATMADTGPSFSLADGARLRWDIDLAADADAESTTGDMAFRIAGTSDQGAFSVAGASRITTEASVEYRDVTVTSPKNGDRYTPNAPLRFTGAGTRGATITITPTNGLAPVTTTVGEDGTWSVQRFMGTGPYTFDVEQDFEGRTSSVTGISVIAVGAPIVRPFAITTPTPGATLPERSVVFSGDGTPGSTVTLHTTNFVSADVTATVDLDGHWSVRRYIGTGAYTFDITQADASGRPNASVLGFHLNQPATAAD